MGSAGKLATSANGTNWSNLTPAAPDTFKGMAYGAGTFVTIGTLATIQSSRDGVTWTNHTQGFPGLSYQPTTYELYPYSLRHIAYGNGRFVLVAEKYGFRPPAIFLSSTNGVTYTVVAGQDGSIPQVLSVVYGKDTFCAGVNESSGKVFTSSDGSSWVPHTIGSPLQTYGLTVGNGLFGSIGYGQSTYYVLRSADGVTWDKEALPFSINLLAFSSGPLAVALNRHGSFWFSNNQLPWTNTDPGISNTLSSLIYANGLFIAVGDQGTIITSPDGHIWTRATSGTTNNLTCVAYGARVFLVGGEEGIFLASPDGLNWSRRWLGTIASIADISFGDNTFTVIAGTNSFSQVPGGPPIVLQSDRFTWLDDERRSDPGGFGMTIRGKDGQSYGIESSSDLVSWTNLTSLTNLGGTTPFLDPTATNYPRRFYRTRLIP